MKSEHIAGVRVDFDLSYSDVLERINLFVKTSNSHYIWTVNPEFIMDSQKDPEFMDVLNMSTISIPDGAGLLYANAYLKGVAKYKRDLLFPFKAFLYGTYFGVSSLWKSYEIGERLSGVDLIHKICENASRSGQTVLLLGGWEKDRFGRNKESSGRIAEKAAQKLVEHYPDLKVVGASSEFSRDASDDENTLEYIHQKMREKNLESIDIVLVAYNHVHQEKWLVRNLSKIPGKVGIGVGGTFDYIAGNQKRSPNTVIVKNLEWLYRLCTQPWRWKRVVKAFPIFPLYVFYLSVIERKRV